MVNILTNIYILNTGRFLTETAHSRLNKAPSLHLRRLITVSAVSDFLGDVHDDPVTLSKCSPKDNAVLMSQKILKISQAVFFFTELAETAARDF